MLERGYMPGLNAQAEVGMAYVQTPAMAETGRCGSIFHRIGEFRDLERIVRH
jgi:hypothetical protein